MAETLTRSTGKLEDLLDELHQMVLGEPRQPLALMAEDAVMHWLRVVEGQDPIQPRLSREGYIPTGFHFGMEPQAENWLDHCAIGGDAEDFPSALRAREEEMLRTMRAFDSHGGYRGSSTLCDQTMLAVARFSRFLNTWGLEGELRHRRRWGMKNERKAGPADIYQPRDAQELLIRTRRALFAWEPFCNNVIVAWEENQLDPFNHAVAAMREALESTIGEHAGDSGADLPELAVPGYPLRPLSEPRQKVVISAPEQRPLRTRTLFPLRMQHLRERMAMAPQPSATLLASLAEDVRHFLAMCQDNHFILAYTPGFTDRNRAGLAVIKSVSTQHPFLLDPQGFFKKAVLFHNGTYSREGGALDQLYLQLRQLERQGNSERWAGETRELRGPIDQCVIAWDENRWDVFTSGLLALGEILRLRHEESA